MPEGSGFPFFGSFYDPLHASQWSSRLKTRVNAETLEDSDVKIAIIALYSHPLFFRSIAGSQRESIRHQIDEARKFVTAHPNWIIAKNAAEARKALDEGKRVLILSLEGASGILENEADIQEFVEKDGVRIVTPLHFMDDWIGGAALMPGAAAIVNPFAAFQSFLQSERDENGVFLNDQGLTSKGHSFIQSLIQHGVWIDLSHSSDKSVRDMLPMLKAAGQPPLFTHTVLRQAFRGERGIPEKFIHEVAANDGILGIIPSDDMLKGTTVPPELCPAECNGQCEGGIAALAAQFDGMKKIIPASHLFIGTDIDAPITFLKPTCNALAAIRPKGYWSYAQIPVLYTYLQDHKLGPEPGPGGTDPRVDAFLNTWAKVH
jgi:microsomal dipeptidase-like Zn-dependent dipeptidase